MGLHFVLHCSQSFELSIRHNCQWQHHTWCRVCFLNIFSIPSWTSACLQAEPTAQPDTSVGSLPLVQNEAGESVMRFFWYDAFEDYFKNPGNFLATVCISSHY